MPVQPRADLTKTGILQRQILNNVLWEITIQSSIYMPTFPHITLWPVVNIQLRWETKGFLSSYWGVYENLYLIVGVIHKQWIKHLSEPWGMEWILCFVQYLRQVLHGLQKPKIQEESTNAAITSISAVWDCLYWTGQDVNKAILFSTCQLQLNSAFGWHKVLICSLFLSP